MCKPLFLPSGCTTSTGWGIELEKDAFGSFCSFFSLLSVWDILCWTFELTFLSQVYDKTQQWSVRRKVRTAQKNIVLLSMVLIRE